MDVQGNPGCWALSDKEKQALRLMVRGHDAKSIARSLGLSVHTINERLREARRKMAVSSSREAARLLLEAEAEHSGLAAPKTFGDTLFGEDASGHSVTLGSAPEVGAERNSRSPWILGVLVMMLVLGFAAMTFFPLESQTPTAPAASATAPDPEVVNAARQWLVLVDEARWDDSYQATSPAFRKLNTPKIWADVSEKVRAPLGAVTSRVLISQENLPAPPSGYEVVKFRTTFANKANAIETVSLSREGGAWRVAGVTIQ